MKILWGYSLAIIIQSLTAIVGAVPMEVLFDRLSPGANTTDRLVFCHFMVGTMADLYAS